MRLEGLLGQKRAAAQLTAEAASGRLAHAYLFVGPQGCGRGTAALALFRALNCERRDDPPCGVCASCRRALAGQHEDLLILAPPHDQASAQIKVEEVREMVRSLSFAPFGGGWRLVLIRQAGQLNPSSANALLKTLEEPPPRNLLVLTVQDPAEVLPTLVSRCRRVNFKPLDEGLIASELERRGLAPEAARLKAALSGGSLGRALELDQELLAANLRTWRERLAQPGDPLADWSLAEELVAPFRGGERLDRQGLVELLDLLALYLRDCAVAAAGRPSAAFLPPELLAGAGLDLERASRGFDLVRQAQSQILGNAAPELAITVLLGRLRA
ncbi:MAG: DNA polymerase III subunit delta' [Desulfarculus sp.]|nr:DNA polymerase III subunit delta' [Desulfarculus sp.]